ncbi:lysozyme inhibitor LprI family protein [Paenibacillus guangzhouensis]|uniref:lysozyme inhibitor LprI family protein n=1 Tax=Paenibacillus guangzhouensis TaxID=1473112 RepID=UPI001266A9AB|nr:lysozyme inhibitor LprI family protein [Paenibacillus guangzhouensis]
MKITKLLLVLAIIILITACRNEVAEKSAYNTDITSKNDDKRVSSQIQSTSFPEVKNQNDSDTIFGSYDISNEFSELMNSNPIDKDYDKEFNEFDNSTEFSTTGWIQFEAKYEDIWDKELNWIYNKLLSKLNTKQKKLLIEAQKGWLQNHLKETEFMVSTFQDDSEYNIGSQGLVNIEIAIKNRLRDRTIQLYEYFFMLGGETEFLYKGKS